MFESDKRYKEGKKKGQNDQVLNKEISEGYKRIELAGSGNKTRFEFYGVADVQKG